MNVGQTTLLNSAYNIFDNLDEITQISVIRNKKELTEKWQDKEDWLLPYYHQVDVRAKSEIGHGLYFSKLKQALFEEKIYFIAMQCDSFALRNDEMNKNIENIGKCAKGYNFDFHVTNDSQGSDGIITLNEDKVFTMLPLDDTNIDKHFQTFKKITVKKGTQFALEIGTNCISKFTAHMLNGSGIARLPYKQAPLTTPFIGFFVNVEKFRHFDV